MNLPRRVGKRRKKQQKQEFWLQLSDYQYPGEKQHYWISVGVILLVAFWIAGLVWWHDRFNTWTYPLAYIPGWVLLSAPLVNYLAAQPRRQQLKKLGHHARVWGNNYPQYHAMLTRLSKLACLRRVPEMYIVDEEAPYLYSLPDRGGTIIVTKALTEVLELDEFETFVAHELGHIKSRHLRLELAMTYVDNVNPTLKFLFGPLTIWRMLMGSWRDVIEYTADRVALLITQKPVALMRAIIKSAAAADAQTDLTQEEIEAYLRESGQVGTDAAEIERYFKISEFISNQPNMRERLQEIGQFLSSEEGKAAFEKIGHILQEVGQRA